MSFELTLIIVIAIFLAILIVEGITSFRRNRGEADFMVAGRSVGPWIGGASLAATQMSAGTFVGTVAVHYLTGASFLWIWAGIWLAYVIAGLWIAPKLRRYSAENGGLTFSQYIGDRYNSNHARGLSAILIVLAYIVFMSAQYQAGGIIFETLLGIPFVYGALILMVVTVLYTVFGGMTAVMRTDFLQQIVMVVGVVVGIPLLLSYAGGWGNVGVVLEDVAPTYLSWEFGFKELAGFILAYVFTFSTAPYILIRFYTMRDDRTIRQSVAVALLFNIVTATSVAIIGMLLVILYPQLFNPDAASTVYASQVLPTFVGALVMVAVLAAVISTVDSVLLVTGPAISHDIYYGILNPEASERKRLLMGRGATLVVGTVPIAITLLQLGLVQFVVLAFASLVASIVFVPVVAGLYWRRANGAGAIGSMVVGFGLCLLWFLLDQPLQLNPAIPGVLGSAISMYVISLSTKPVPTENLRPFFSEPMLERESDSERGHS